MIVSKKTSFDAAHYLPLYEGKCNQMHGHHWVIELAVLGEVDLITGMVMDFQVLKDFLDIIKTDFDHALLNEFITNPTAENIASYVKHMWESKKPVCELAWVKVWETEDSYALLS